MISVVAAADNSYSWVRPPTSYVNLTIITSNASEFTDLTVTNSTNLYNNFIFHGATNSYMNFSEYVIPLFGGLPFPMITPYGATQNLVVDGVVDTSGGYGIANLSSLKLVTVGLDETETKWEFDNPIYANGGVESNGTLIVGPAHAAGIAAEDQLQNSSDLVLKAAFSDGLNFDTADVILRTVVTNSGPLGYELCMLGNDTLHPPYSFFCFGSGGFVFGSGLGTLYGNDPSIVIGSAVNPLGTEVGTAITIPVYDDVDHGDIPFQIGYGAIYNSVDIGSGGPDIHIPASGNITTARNWDFQTKIVKNINKLRVANGARPLPVYSFDTDIDTGLTRTALANTMELVVGAMKGMSINQTDAAFGNSTSKVNIQTAGNISVSNITADNMNTGGKIYFRDANIYATSTDDGWLNLFADIGVEINSLILNVAALYSVGNIEADGNITTTAYFGSTNLTGANNTLVCVNTAGTLYRC